MSGELNKVDLRIVRDALLSVGVPVYHYYAKLDENSPDKLIVWAETGVTKQTYYDNRMGHQSFGGTIEFYTKEEFDPLFDMIQAAMNMGKFGWGLTGIEYDIETGYIHYSWGWELR